MISSSKICPYGHLYTLASQNINNMKICISTNKGGLEDQINPHFGRAPTFTFVSIENGEIKNTEVIANPFMNATCGAGIQSAQLAAQKGVSAVISGSFGPHAYNAFQTAKIEMITVTGITVKDAALLYAKGELKQTTTQTPMTDKKIIPQRGGERHRHGRRYI